MIDVGRNAGIAERSHKRQIPIICRTGGIEVLRPNAMTRLDSLFWQKTLATRLHGNRANPICHRSHNGGQETRGVRPLAPMMGHF